MGLLQSVSLPKFALQWKSLGEPCANRDCKPSSILNSLGKKREGLRIGETFYCCASCFENGVRDRLAELCRMDIPSEQHRRFRVPLGLVLLSRGAVNNQQLQSALAEQKTNGGRIGEVLTRLGYASEEQVTAAAATQWGYPVFSLKDRMAETQVEIPHSLLDLHSILPVHYVRASRQLMIGFVQQIDHNLLFAIEQMTNTTTVPCFITPSDFRARIRGLASNFQNEEVIFDRANSTSEMARIVQSYAGQIGAQSARITRCRNFIWSRVEGRRQNVELLFKLPGR